jgi:hypothetical protein
MWSICGLYVDYIWNISEADTEQVRHSIGTGREQE